jgi:hypothetical protein
VTITLNTLLASPDLMPLQLDLGRQRVQFVPLTAGEYRNAAFLDDRTQRKTPRVCHVDLRGLLEHLRCRQLPRPVHYVLHGALCCSTLLARYLEGLSDCFVLKEPFLLTQIAMLRYGASVDGTASRNQIAAEWPSWFDMSTFLLARSYGASDSVVIKVNDLCNALGEDLLARDSRSKILFLQSPLKTFLLSALNSFERRRWVRGRLLVVGCLFARIPFLADVEPSDLSDSEAAAALWLFNCAVCQFMLSGPAAHRVMTLNGEAVADRPRDTLCIAREFFGLGAADAGADLTDIPSSRHAKDISVPYDAHARARDRTKTEAQFGAETEAGIAWAMRTASTWTALCPFPFR